MRFHCKRGLMEIIHQHVLCICATSSEISQFGLTQSAAVRAAWWFQKGSVIRSEATVNLDLNTKVRSCRAIYTYP